MRKNKWEIRENGRWEKQRENVGNLSNLKQRGEKTHSLFAAYI